MAEVARADIESALQGYEDPYLRDNLQSAGAIKDIAVNDGRVRIEVVLGFPAAGYRDQLAHVIRERAQAVPGVSEVEVDIRSEIVSHAVQQGIKPLPNVKNVIAVASGKGGVGKSTTAVNLALALSQEGANVGVLDADIYGPNQPRMLGVTGQPESRDGKTMEPLMGHGVQSMSIGYLVDEESPMVWRGPMVTQALQQLIGETNWRDLDYLVIDLPPGTGDIQLTLSQRIPVTGSVIVTTPQDIALLDARKAVKMFEKVNVPVLGIVENMSTHICSNCGHEESVFGAGGGQGMAEQYGVELLGQLPLAMHIREQADSGQPTVVADPAGAVAGTYRQIARRVAARIARMGKDYSHKFPNIAVENT